MIARELICDGKLLEVGVRIGRGGEGQVFAINDGSGRAVKIYFDPTTEREAKIRAMIGAGIGNSCPNVAFPLGAAYTASGAFAGFTMRKVTAHQPIHQLFNSKSRQKTFPDSDYKFLVRVAANVAKCVANVHHAGVVIGDINSSGFLVSSTGLVTLIDADSFQFEDFGCHVGMPEYTPPELQGISLASVRRTINNDRFGLAALIFQNVMLGWHPFSGVTRGGLQTPDAAIARGQFSFSILRNTGASPPPAAPYFQDLSRNIRLLFECAFGPCIEARPAAVEWVHALDELEKVLVPCPDRRAHYTALPGRLCSLCRLEKTTGRSVFPLGPKPQIKAVSRSALDSNAFAYSLISIVKSYADEDFSPKWYIQNVQVSDHARQLKWDRPAAGQTYLGFGSSVSSPVHRLVEQLATLSAQAKGRLNAWQNEIGLWEIHRHAELLHKNVILYENAKNSKSRLTAERLAKVVSARAESLLGTIFISGAEITGIGHATRSRLASQGIATAANISGTAVSSVRGLGPDRAFSLLVWRERLLVDAERGLGEHTEFMRVSSESVTVGFQRDLTRLAAIIEATAADLDQRVASFQSAAQMQDEMLATALTKRDQAICDLRYLGVDPDEALKRLNYNQAVSAAQKITPLRGRPRVQRRRSRP